MMQHGRNVAASVLNSNEANMYFMAFVPFTFCQDILAVSQTPLLQISKSRAVI